MFEVSVFIVNGIARRAIDKDLYRFSKFKRFKKTKKPLHSALKLLISQSFLILYQFDNLSENCTLENWGAGGCHLRDYIYYYVYNHFTKGK